MSGPGEGRVVPPSSPAAAAARAGTAPGGLVRADPGRLAAERAHEPRRSDVRQRQLRLLVLLVAVVGVLWLARGIIGPFVVAAVAAYAFDPIVSAAQRRSGLPRAVVILIGYVILIVALVALVVLLANRIGTELRELSGSGPDVLATALQRLVGDHVAIAGQQIDVPSLARQLHDSILGLVRTPTDAIHMATQAVDLALQTVLTLIVAFYFLLDGHRFAEFGLRFLDRRRRVRTVQIAGRIHEVLGRWLRGQLFLIGLVAVVLYVVLGPVLHIHFALILAILSGVLEIIPLVGPLIAAALTCTVAFSSGGGQLALVVAVVYLIVRQVEDQVIMPIVIGRAVHLHPVVTIFAVLVGLSVWGILGGLLGVPVAAALNVTLHELYPEASSGGGSARTQPARAERVRADPEAVEPGAAPAADA